MGELMKIENVCDNVECEKIIKKIRFEIFKITVNFFN